VWLGMPQGGNTRTIEVPQMSIRRRDIFDSIETYEWN
jgi:hypothetical protein